MRVNGSLALRFSGLLCLVCILLLPASCGFFLGENASDEDPGAALDVELEGLPGGSEGGKTLASNLTVTVKAFDAIYRTQIGSDATLAWDTASQKYKGSLTIPDNSGSIYILAYGVNATGEHVARASANPTVTTGTSSLSLIASSSYTVGDSLAGLAPGGGQVFYDKGYYSNGWRYLEASPTMSSYDWEYNWGGKGTRINSDADDLTDHAIGSGAANTQRIVTALGTGVSYAARYADELNHNGMTDWFLPSWYELEEMHNKCMGLTRPANSYRSFWSSTEDSADNGHYVCFDGEANPYDSSYEKGSGMYVRAARDL